MSRLRLPKITLPSLMVAIVIVLFVQMALNAVRSFSITGFPLDPAALLTIGLALLGLYVAIRQLRQAQKHAQEHAQDLGKISASLTTAFIGAYPRQLGRVKELLKEARNRVVIVCPTLTYGQIGRRSEWRELMRRLDDLAESRTCTVKTIVLRGLGRIEYRQARYGSLSDRDWNSWKERWRDDLQDFLSKDVPDLSEATKVENLKLERFLDLRYVFHKRALEQRSPKLQVQESDVPLPLYLWIVDDKAVFSIPEHVDREGELSFYTADSRLVEALTKFADRHLTQSSETSIKTINATALFDGEEISRATETFFAEANSVRMLGLTGTFTETQSRDLDFVRRPGTNYHRVANLIPYEASQDELEVLKKNVEQFLRLYEYRVEGSLVSVFHSPLLARGENDLHFRLDDQQVVLRLADKASGQSDDTSDLNTAIVLRDPRSMNAFRSYYSSLCTHDQARLLGKEQLEYLRDLLNDMSANPVGLVRKIREYLGAPPGTSADAFHHQSKREVPAPAGIKAILTQSTRLEELMVSAPRSGNLIDESLVERLVEVFNQYGLAILDCAERCPEESLLLLEGVFGLLDGNHDRADDQGLVEIAPKAGYRKYLGTTSGPHPLHTDGSYRLDPPGVMALYCVSQSPVGGETVCISCQGIYEHLRENAPDSLGALFDVDACSVRRGRTHVNRPVFRRLESGALGMAWVDSPVTEVTVKKEGEFAFELIRAYIKREERILRFRLAEGQVLIVDNMALLHGREAFDTNAETTRKLLRANYDGRPWRATGRITIGF